MFTRSDSAITVGRVAGAPVKVGPGALVIACILAYQFGSQWTSTSSTAVAWVAALATAVLFLASILAHEAGHAFVARRAGVDITEIRLWLLGGAAAMQQGAPDGRSEMRIAAAGPVVSVAVGIAGIAAAAGAAAIGLPEPTAQALTWLGVINFILAAFNMLPGLPLDGGRVLTGWLWKRRGSRISAVRTTARVGRGLAALAFGLAAVEVFVLGSAAGIFTAFIGLVLSQGSTGELARAELIESVTGRTVGDVTFGEPPTVSSSMNTASARAMLPPPQVARWAVVVDDDGIARGVLDLVVLDAAASRDGTDPVDGVMTPVDQNRAAFETETLDSVLSRGVPLPFVVIDDEWKPTGLVVGIPPRGGPVLGPEPVAGAGRD